MLPLPMTHLPLLNPVNPGNYLATSLHALHYCSTTGMFPQAAFRVCFRQVSHYNLRQLQRAWLWNMCAYARRCVQVHGCLGRLGAFQESYQRNRRLQLNSDLAPPANFLEGYRPFIAQLTGFFIIEDRVQRRCHALCTGAQVTHPLTHPRSP